MNRRIVDNGSTGGEVLPQGLGLEGPHPSGQGGRLPPALTPSQAARLPEATARAQYTEGPWRAATDDGASQRAPGRVAIPPALPPSVGKGFVLKTLGGFFFKASRISHKKLFRKCLPILLKLGGVPS